MRTTIWIAALLAVPALVCADPAPSTTDLTAIGLEDLMQLEVTSVSRHEEPLFRAASAITVLTADDIARSGATTLPDLLRSVPGMDVAQINASTWAVSARGFGGQYANKMLVLVDGRTVYNPLFSGVYWEVLDVLLEDIQRIEVIRGPGATAWGANAVNGVINIITRPAGTAPGLIAIANGGSRLNEIGGLRYAGPAGPTAEFRVFAKYQNAGRLEALNGGIGHDARDLGHAGGRLDWHRGPRDEATLQGDFYSGAIEQRVAQVLLDPPYSVLADYSDHADGGDLMGTWQHTLSPSSEFRFKAYIDQTDRTNSETGEHARTFDIDFQHRRALGQRHDFMWGGGYRIIVSRFDGSPITQLEPAGRTSRLANVFVQDAVEVVPRRLTLTLGSKFEHNDFTGYEAEPSARVLWAASPTQTVWGAVSRAVRTPSLSDQDLNVIVASYPLGGGAVGITRLSSDGLQSEILTSFELGYRTQLDPRLSLDVTGFRNRYLRLRAVESGPSYSEDDPPPTHTVFPIYFRNRLSASTRGLETTLDWRPNVRFGMAISHALYYMRLEANPGPVVNPDGSAGDAPTYQLSVRPHVRVARHLDFDATWYHVDDLPTQQAPAYDRVDARLGWTPVAGLELSAGVQNLFHDRDPEFGSTTGTGTATTVRTGAYGKVTWKR